MGMQLSLSQAEHPKLAKGFEVFASNAQTSWRDAWALSVPAQEPQLVVAVNP